jgi:MtrB/PioB family decaheme-associated outer membrane protein
MKRANPLILLGVFSLLPAAAAADDAAGAAAVDTSKWLCKLCKFETGTSGSVEVGAGNVSDKSAKFGEYNGLDDKGGYLIGGASARYRGADGTYWNARASDLGLDSRSAQIDGGRQGAYGLFLRYDEIPHVYSDSAQTPFLGSGGASLTLPAGFPAGTTGLMPLAGTLQTVDIENKRKRIGVGASWLPVSGWKYALSFRHESREGTKRASGAFFVNAAQLIEPVDYDTDQIDASASYSGRRLQAKLAYYGSRFSNANDALTWQNPFSVPGFPAASAGQRALPPDNQFHQVSATLGYQFTDRTRASADIAWGRMTQNESFLAPTLNGTLAVPALPRSSLDGRVTTLNADVKLSSALTERLRLNASYAHDDRDNHTPQATYSWVTTDMFLGTPRTNLPYGFTRDLVKLSGDYRLSPRLQASAGADHERVKRTYQEVDRTRESTVWGKGKARLLDKIDLTLKLAHAERRNSGYQVVSGVTPPENPLLRKYNMASRDRDSATLRADVAATERLSLGLGADLSKDSYFDSQIGLTGAKDYGLNGDASFMLSEQTSLNAFASRETIKSAQSGSQLFAAPDWTAENHDTVDVLGVGLRHAAIKDKLELGADYTLTRTRSEVRVATGAAQPGFPDFATKLHTFSLYATYRVNKQVSLNGGYWYQRYRSADWMLDGVTPATITNVLTLGEQPPQYRVDVVHVTVRYAF